MNIPTIVIAVKINKKVQSISCSPISPKKPINDLIEISIYFYLSNRNLYKFFNKNFIISYKNLEYICNDIFSETVSVLV